MNYKLFNFFEKTTGQNVHREVSADTVQKIGFGILVAEGLVTTGALLTEAAGGASSGNLIATLAVGVVSMVATGVAAVRISS